MGLGVLKERRSKQGRPGQEKARGRWYLILEGFSTGPGNTKLVTGRYMVKAVDPQVWVQGGSWSKQGDMA